MMPGELFVFRWVGNARTIREPLPGYRCVGRRSCYRPSGHASDGELADIRQMQGFPSPGPAYRRWLIRRWAEMVGDRIRVALLVREDQVCPNRTGGLIVAAEERMKANLFVSEPEALQWLEAGE
jgi:hypothetical protein